MNGFKKLSWVAAIVTLLAFMTPMAFASMAAALDGAVISDHGKATAVVGLDFGVSTAAAIPENAAVDSATPTLPDTYAPIPAEMPAVAIGGASVFNSVIRLSVGKLATLEKNQLERPPSTEYRAPSVGFG